MTIRGQIPVQQGDTLGAARELLRTLLDRQVVQALLVPMEGANQSVMPALVRHPSRLDRANPFAPVMAFNGARLVSMLTRENTGTTLGVVLRSCEIRALMELAKFNQAKLDHVVIIGVDCLGTYGVPEYGAALKQSSNLTAQYLMQAQSGQAEGLGFRTACAMCEHPTPEHADISIGLIGVDNAQALVVEVRDDIAEKMGLNAAPMDPQRDTVLTNLVAARTAHRDRELAQFHEQVKAIGMAAYFANCLECTNCMNACPICYCKECFFRTANAEHSTRDLLVSAERQGTVPMPPDAVLFQLTRLNHMATSCVGCGMCEAACPHDIPLTAMFRSVGARVQKTFGYEPGKDVNDKPPFMVFRRDELEEIGES